MRIGLASSWREHPKATDVRNYECGPGAFTVRSQTELWQIVPEACRSLITGIFSQSELLQALARENCAWQWQPRRARPVIKAQRAVLVQRKSYLSSCNTYSGFCCRRFEGEYQAQEQHHRVWIDAFKHADNELLDFIDELPP